MTAQFNDQFIHRENKYAIAGISTGMLFDPAIFGLEPVMASTACWRGYIATFSIADSHLILDELAVNLYEDELQNTYAGGPPINGIKPVSPTDTLKLFNNMYTNLNYPLEYTGGLLLGSGFIRALYVHMGFHPAWKYETVIELLFENGALTSEFDRSEKMAELRTMMQELSTTDKSDRMPTRDEISEFVERAFDRTYTR